MDITPIVTDPGFAPPDPDMPPLDAPVAGRADAGKDIAIESGKMGPDPTIVADNDFPTPTIAENDPARTAMEDEGLLPAEEQMSGGAPGTRAGDQQKRGETPTIMDQVESTPDFAQER